MITLQSRLSVWIATIFSKLSTWIATIPFSRVVLGQALASGLTTLAFIVLISAIYRIYGNEPPIILTSLNPEKLGALCPGQQVPVDVHIHITDKIIAIYFISTTKLNGQNIIGAQTAFTDNLYPDVMQFTSNFPWTVPDIPPGAYKRVFAARNVSGHQNTAWIVAYFEIKENCS